MGLNREIFKHTSIYSFATILGRLISFIMLPFYAHIFQTEGYGVIGMIDASLGILGVLFASGFHVAILKIFHEEDEQNKKLVISTAIRLIWGLSLAAVVVPMIFSTQLSRIFLGSEKYSLLLLLSLITFVIDVSGQSASTFLIIKQKSIFYTVVGLIRLLIGIAMNIWLVLILNVGLIGVFITSLLMAVVASSLFHYAAFREHGFTYDKAIAKKLLQFQLPLMPGEIVSFASRQTERFIVRFIVGISGVGILEMAYKFPPLIILFITAPFMRAWRTKSMEIAEQEDAPLVIGKMFTKYFFVIVLVGLLLALTIQDILKIMTPPQFWEAVGIAHVEIITTIIFAANAFLIFGLYYKKKTTYISTIKTTVMLVKILISVILIHFFRLKGAAYSALMAETVMLLFITFKSQQCYPIKMEILKLSLITGYGISIYCLVHYINQTDYYAALTSSNNFHDLIRVLLDWPLFQRPVLLKLEGILTSKIGNIISLLFNFLSGLAFLLLMLYFRFTKNTDGLQNTKLVNNEVS